MTFYEARDYFVQCYLMALLDGRHRFKADAARHAGMNRTHLYQLARRHGVLCSEPRKKKPPPPVASNHVASQFLSAR